MLLLYMSICDSMRFMAQQCSSVSFFSMNFYSRKENFGPGLKNVNIQFLLLLQSCLSLKLLNSGTVYCNFALHSVDEI